MDVEDRTTLDKYPSWTDALFGDDTVANVRCAIEYVVWLGMYAVLLVVGVVLLSVAYPIQYINRHVQSIRSDSDSGSGRLSTRVDSASDWFDRILGHERVKDAAEWVVTGGFIVAAIAVVGLVVFSLYMLITRDPMVLGVFVALCVAILAAMYGIAYVHDWWLDYSREHHPIQRAKNRAVDTPGVRRIYGKCPVSFDMEPKFFQHTTDWMESKLD